MLFGLSSAGSSFFYPIEQCLGDQQFVTLMLYLDDICIFAPSIEVMLDHVTILSWCSIGLKNSTSQLSLRNTIFDISILFLSHLISARGILANPGNVEMVSLWV